MPILTVAEYFGPWADHPDLTPDRRANAEKLVLAINALFTDLMRGLIYPRTNPKTNSVISGEMYGGFRPGDCPIGRKGSSHKEGQGADLFDLYAAISGHLFVRQELLRKHGLWMEHPNDTPGWCHLQTRPVKSGNTVFFP
jgi:hypothetical protein